MGDEEIQQPIKDDPRRHGKDIRATKGALSIGSHGGDVVRVTHMDLCRRQDTSKHIIEHGKCTGRQEERKMHRQALHIGTRQ